MNREKRDILKLYEIAVYALSKEKLKKRVDKKIHKLMDDYNKPGVSEKMLRQAIEIESFPPTLMGVQSHNRLYCHCKDW